MQNEFILGVALSDEHCSNEFTDAQILALLSNTKFSSTDNYFPAAWFFSINVMAQRKHLSQ